MSMKALVMPRVGEVAVADKPIPEPGPDDVIVRTTAALVCTSDVHTVNGGMQVQDGVTLGHESVGVIAAIGSNIDGFHEGQRVAAPAVTPCWECRYCQTGFSSQCQGLLGGYRYTAQVDGNMSEYFVVPKARGNLAPIPDGVSDEMAVYACDMLSTGFSGAEKSYLRLGDTVAIFAMGPVGLSATIGAALLGASRIFAVETRPDRQKLALSFGATDIIDFAAGDPVDQIRAATDGEGVDAAIEAFGYPQTWEACIRVTKPGGRVSNVGYHGDSDEPLHIPLDAYGLGMADKSIYGGLCPGGNDRMQRIFALMAAGRFDPTSMTTHRFGFDQVERAFRMMQTKEDGIIKPLITF
ncbi:NAD(P)-dependent alcohol dehydrogenase [Rhodococcus sp. IEGM 1381]|uniref:NAD(P)-dependent alcohol dehydrogenase n=1 Tax=Rhodococcus sp. IEGM 1381 TaxID=3047085 RepID=UPI0024B747EA|nr:NAD(P)-dependent alcohol dehydrogenase [Rhodococcus sp. IEGM 1381]MDI9894540.1 NAD(P)-dependent alcohol dehydrogenase [Rhodococcus sp. IEGM 1381]